MWAHEGEKKTENNKIEFFAFKKGMLRKRKGKWRGKKVTESITYVKYSKRPLFVFSFFKTIFSLNIYELQELRHLGTCFKKFQIRKNVGWLYENVLM